MMIWVNMLLIESYRWTGKEKLNKCGLTRVLILVGELVADPSVLLMVVRLERLAK